MSEQDSVLNNKVSLKGNGQGETEEEKPVYDFTPELEFFYDLGKVHNACLDYMLGDLSSLPMAYDSNGKEVLALEFDLLNDYVFRGVLDYLQTKYMLTQADLAACSTYRNYYIDEQHDYLNYPLLAPTYMLEYYWDMTKGIVYNEKMDSEQMAEELGFLLENAYWDLYNDGEEGFSEDDFTFLSYIAITRSSIQYWSNPDNMLTYMDVYYLLTDDWEYSPAKARGWWRADGRGAIAGGIAAGATGCWFLIPLVAVISSATVAINDWLRDDLQHIDDINSCQPVKNGNMVLYKACQVDLNQKYDLFNATKETKNPYRTGDYWEVGLPNGMYY